MLTTSHSFIHEYSMYDEVLEVLERADNAIKVAFFDFDKKQKDHSVESFFENGNDTYFLEQEKEGLLAKVGKLIVGLIEALGKFIKELGEKIFGTGKKLQTDAEIVTKMVAENPGLAENIKRGISEEWFSYADLAAYEKDMVGLQIMVEKNAMDHKTAKEKRKEKREKHLATAKTVLATGTTVVGILALIPKAVKAWKDNKEVVDRAKGRLSEYKEKLDKKILDGEDSAKIMAEYESYKEYTADVIKAMNDQGKKMNFLSEFFHKIASGAKFSAAKSDDKRNKQRADDAKAASDAAAKADEDAKKARQKKIDDDIADEKYKKEQRKAAGLSTDNGGKKKK